MLKRHFVIWAHWMGLLVLAAGAALGQEYPSKPVRIVTSGVGGGNDLMARYLALGLTNPLGQPVVVENRGGSSVIPGEVVSQAPPDGYTVLYASSSLWIVPLIQKASYDAVRDFSPVSLLNRAPNVLVVHPSLPVKSVKDLIALALARPGELNYASSGIGTSLHLAGELFKSMAGVRMVHVAYKGGGASVNAVIAGEVQLTFSSAPAATQYLKSGRLRALAVTSAEPFALLPGLPTVAAAGLPGYEATSIDGILAPAKTPAAIVNRLNQELVRLLKHAEVQEKFQNSGAEMVGSSPDQFAAAIKADVARLSKVIKDAGIRAD